MIESSFVSGDAVEYVVSTETPWYPVKGEFFFAPDLLSLKMPVARMVWQGTDSDMNLLSMRFVYASMAGAMNKYRLLKGISYMIAQDEIKGARHAV